MQISPHLTTPYTLPLSTFTTTHYPHCTTFIVGAYIFTTPSPSPSPTNSTPQPQTLLLLRSPTDSYPLHWENPGGSTDPSDPTLLAALAREVFEETGLPVTKVVDLVAVDEWTRVRRGRGVREMKWSFLVEVGGGDGEEGDWEERVKLAPEEHCAWSWVGEEDIRKVVEGGEGIDADGEGHRLRFIGDQGRNLLKAFEVYKRVYSV
ncbi:hypothetical protein BO78DRAFT_430457 [Aspergillus sclerotiicarbonarius CBS 121057]|uniref:Nudix hydrolase domain-containing protein n=1 Tax=Aspergillus sclerotiicarbonarius (strain CBS 121057 / IBT 28362) TaxID=1448318 RepID=A0A319E5Z9_ASPSB|nr:hypothetical protein BO78DRAFT_430457 [Aspergillus sclerotiicarbonarius CBS 121057]